MHRCLTIVEIVDLICSQLYSPSDEPWFAEGGGSPHDLAAAARTCTTFNGPALNYLWRSVTLKTLLIQCMPSDLWTVEANQNPTHILPFTKMRLLRPIRVSDWDRVRVYASRVKKLACHSDASLTILPALGLTLPDTLFSNLQSLFWHPYTDRFHHIVHFLRPTLTEMTLHLSSYSDSSLLPTLLAKCPKMTNISIAYTSDNLCSDVSRFLCKLHSATAISVSPSVDEDAFQYFSSMPDLKSLALDTLPGSFRVSSQPVFPTLRQMTLASPTIGSAIYLFDIYRNLSLQTFRAGFDGTPATASEARRLFAALATGCSHSSLTSLILEDDGQEGEEEGDPAIYLAAYSTVQQFFCFRRLTTLNLTFVVGFDLDDNNAAELACAWPQIEVLLLSCCCLADSQPTDHHCPQLRTLGIAFDTHSVPAPSETDPSTHVQHRCLELLDVGHSPIAVPLSVARFISGVLPTLKTIRTHREYNDNEDEEELEENQAAIICHNRWKEVQMMLPEVLAIREEERILVQGGISKVA
ncbi:hypothetical protein DFH06DRAFT_1309513 [Mycena polygramma]|nr:hypothetical protein DFH06DRAFT_1309513 [Mycena polygramma]